MLTMMESIVFTMIAVMPFIGFFVNYF